MKWKGSFNPILHFRWGTSYADLNYVGLSYSGIIVRRTYGNGVAHFPGSSFSITSHRLWAWRLNLVALRFELSSVSCVWLKQLDEKLSTSYASDVYVMWLGLIELQRKNGEVSR